MSANNDDTSSSSKDPLSSSLSAFCSSIQRNVSEARSLTDRRASSAAVSAASYQQHRRTQSRSHGIQKRPLLPSSSSTTTSTTTHNVQHETDLAVQFLSDQRTRRLSSIEQSLHRIADVLLSYPASSSSNDDHHHHDQESADEAACSLAELTELCATVYENHAVELASLEDTMVNRHGYDGMEARVAAIAALERREIMEAEEEAEELEDDMEEEGYREEEDEEDRAEIGQSLIIRQEEDKEQMNHLLPNAEIDETEQDARTARYENTQSQSQRQPLSIIGQNSISSTNPLLASQTESSKAAKQQPQQQPQPPNADEQNDSIFLSPPNKIVNSSTFVPPTPQTPITPSLASLHLSHCTATVLAESLDFGDAASLSSSSCLSDEDENDEDGSGAVGGGGGERDKGNANGDDEKDSAASEESSGDTSLSYDAALQQSTAYGQGQSPLTTTSAQREEMECAAGATSQGRMNGVVRELEDKFGEEGNATSAVASASASALDTAISSNVSEGNVRVDEVQVAAAGEEKSRDAVDVVDGLDDVTEQEDGSCNRSSITSDEESDDDDSSSGGYLSDEEEDEDTCTVERDPAFEETVLNDGCSVATVSTVIADRKLAQILATIEQEANATKAKAVDRIDQENEGDVSNDDVDSGDEGDSSSDESSRASKSSIDRLIDESDSNAAQRHSVPTHRARATPILDRYRVSTIDGQMKVSPKEPEEQLQITKSPQVSPFGKYQHQEEDGGNVYRPPSESTFDASLSQYLHRPTYRYEGGRKVYPKTPISKFPVPREEDEEDESETSEELEVISSPTVDPKEKTDHVATTLNEPDSLENCDIMSPLVKKTTAIYDGDGLVGNSQPCANKTPSRVALESSPICRTPLAAAWVAKNMPKDKDRLLAILSPTSGGKPALSTKNRCSNNRASNSSLEDYTSRSPRLSSSEHFHAKSCGNKDYIRPLTVDEYDKAPRIVKSQVDFDAVGAAITALNSWISNHGHIEETERVYISEEQAYCILGDMFNQKKAKTICMSLVTWKRLLMQGNSDSGLTFVARKK